MLEGTSQVLECACAHLPLTFDQRELGEPRGDSLLFGAFRHESGDHDLGTPTASLDAAWPSWVLEPTLHPFCCCYRTPFGGGSMPI